MLPDRLCLCDHSTTGAKSFLHTLIKGEFKENLSGTNRVRSIANNHIETSFRHVSLHILTGITADELHTLVIPHTGDGREVLLGSVNDHLIDLADGHFLHRLVAKG